MTNDQNEYPVALITGASGGIGAAIAKKLHDDGFFVVLSGSNATKLKAQQQEIASDRVAILTCNLSCRAERSELIEKCLSLTGQKLDVLVANAGITSDTLMMRMDDDSWDKVIDINLTANFEICRSALKSMMKKRYGRIVLMSSVTAHGGNAGQANYTASKAGLEAMAKSLAREVAPRGITVNTIAPGFIDTPMTAALTDSVKEQILSHIPQKKMGTPQDIAHAVGFLVSREAAYITGETLHVNGGMYMS